MEYQKHKCCGSVCDCFEISRVMDRIKSVTYYQVYNAAKEAFVFSFSFIQNCTVGRINRRRKNFIYKALPPNTDHSSDTEGIPESWTQAPPRRNALKILNTIINEHRDSLWRLKVPVFLGVRGVNNAPPSANKREKFNVHKFVQRENQTESFAV